MNDLHTLELPKRSVKGIGLVILTHALILWGLASGLATHFVKKATPAAVFIDKPDKPRQIEPPKTDLPPVKFNAPLTPQVPLPDIRVELTPSPITIEVTSEPRAREAGPGTGSTSGGTGVVETGAKSHGPLRAEAICQVMATPEVPTVSWSGQATLRIQAQLVAGRVADVQFLSISGGMDGRTRRALQSAVQAALGAYQCQGSQPFVQEFVFNVQ